MLDLPPDKQLSFEDKIGLLVDHEWTERENRRVARRVKEARLSVRAAPEEIVCDAARGIDKPMLRDLMTGQWVRSHFNVIAIGPTGIGKSFLANALAQSACRQGFVRCLCECRVCSSSSRSHAHRLRTPRCSDASPKLTCSYSMILCSHR
jgi:hypothetical protein